MAILLFFRECEMIILEEHLILVQDLRMYFIRLLMESIN